MRKITMIIFALCSLVFLSSCGAGDKNEQTTGMLSELDPQIVFSYFEQICAIPRDSGNTQKISDYVTVFAEDSSMNFHLQDKNCD